MTRGRHRQLHFLLFHSSLPTDAKLLAVYVQAGRMEKSVEVEECVEGEEEAGVEGGTEWGGIAHTGSVGVPPSATLAGKERSIKISGSPSPLNPKQTDGGTLTQGGGRPRRTSGGGSGRGGGRRRMRPSTYGDCALVLPFRKNSGSPTDGIARSSGYGGGGGGGKGGRCA